MRHHTIKALVIKRRILPDGSKFLTLFSEEMGKVEAVARAGARPSRWSGRFEPLLLLSLSLFGSRSPYRITTAEVLEDFPALTSSPQTLQKVAPFIFLLTRAFPIQDPYPDIFSLVLEILHILPDCSRSDSIYLYFNYRCLLSLGGIPPEPALAPITLQEICENQVPLLQDAGFHSRLRSAWLISLNLNLAP